MRSGSVRMAAGCGWGDVRLAAAVSAAAEPLPVRRSAALPMTEPLLVRSWSAGSDKTPIRAELVGWR